MLKNEKHVAVKEKTSQEIKEEILATHQAYGQAFVEPTPVEEVSQYTSWKLEQFAIKEQEKEDNKLELAYHFKEQHGQLTRNVPVYCAKRLLEIVRVEGKDTYKDRYVTKPKSKHKKTA